MPKTVNMQMVVRKITTIPVDQVGGTNTAVELVVDPTYVVKKGQAKRQVSSVGQCMLVFDTDGIEPGFDIGAKFSIDIAPAG